MNKAINREINQSFKNGRSFAYPDYFRCSDALNMRLNKVLGISACGNEQEFYGFSVLFNWAAQEWVLK